MPIWTFVRHGESVANRERWLAGYFDAPLTEQGQAQAIAARRELFDPPPARAFCSDLVRAHLTARLLLEGRDIPLVVTPRLRERDCGAWERRSLEQLETRSDYRERLGTWVGKPPSGESLFDVAIRVVGWIASIDDSPSDTLIVAHGALMRAVIAVFDELPRARMDLWRPGNCEAIRRDAPVGRWKMLLDDLRREATLTSSGQAR